MKQKNVFIMLVLTVLSMLSCTIYFIPYETEVSPDELLVAHWIMVLMETDESGRT